MRTTTRESYARRIQSVLDHIATHPGHALDLERLAEQAHLSPFHFHRVYVAMMGETLTETIRRHRLSAAAATLLSSATPIDRIARDAGYGSAAAFARIFGKAYGVTPTQYRRHGALSCAIERRRLAATPLTTQESRTMLKLDDVTIQQQPEVEVLALEHRGDYQTIGRSFEKLMAWAAGHDLLDQPMRCYALYYDDPTSKPKAHLRSEACLAPERSDALDAIASGDVHALTIPAGRCATYLFKGPYAELDKPYRWLYDTWLGQSGEELAFVPPYEEYLNDARVTPPAELLTRICLPLKD